MIASPGGGEAHGETRRRPRIFFLSAGVRVPGSPYDSGQESNPAVKDQRPLDFYRILEAGQSRQERPYKT